MTHTIVVADDEAHITHVVCHKLSNAGFTTVVAHDGEEALELCLKHLPSMVITDLQMPYMSGLELSIALKEDERTSETPVLMLTARGYAIEQSELAKTNIKKVMSKPFSPREVLLFVQNELYCPPAEEDRDAA